jgi:hypothetical protein
MAIPIMIGVRAMGVISQISLPTYAMLQKDRPGVMRALSLQMGLTGMVIVPSALATALLRRILFRLFSAHRGPLRSIRCGGSLFVW